MGDFLEMSLHCALFIGVIACLRALFKRCLPRTAFVVLWLAAVARMLCPVELRSPVSIWRLAQQAPGRVIVPVKLSQAPAAPTASGPDWLFLGWALVAAVLLMGIFVLYVANAQTCRTLRWLGGNAYECAGVDAPCVHGIFRPRILLPPDTPGSALPYVLRHERVHVRRRDNLWKLLALTAGAVHWFNPAAWLLVALLNRDLEVSCDDWALRGLDVAERRSYALSLLAMAERPRGRTPLNCGFVQNPLEERIQSIMKHTKKSLLALGAAIVMVLSATAVFATDAPNNPDWKEDLISFFVWTDEDDGIIADGLTDVNAYIATVSDEDLEPLTAEEYEAQVAESEAYLAQRVADGKMTQAEADEALAAMREILEELQSGDVFMFKSVAPEGEMDEVMVTVTGGEFIGTMNDDVSVGYYEITSDVDAG